ncbi:MAG: DUF368 domain-containing protein [Defluviitaleaceae bacterium]|nr:DUF368 domain-containing protein [Defluviitaleaceae bacterium]
MILNAVKGIFIGLALVIPGLSASTLAVVMGMYDELINNINGLRKEFKKSVKFLLPVGIGAMIGILASAGFLLWVIETFELPSYAFFIGLVLGSVPVIFKKMKPAMPKKWNYGLLVVGLIAIPILHFISPEADYNTQITAIGSFGDVAIIFIAGFVACFLIALPGVSGAMILILIGQFATVYGAVSNFADALVMTVRGQEDAWYQGLSAMLIVLVFFAGSVLGLFVAARLIGALIKRYEASVYFAVMGIIIGAAFVLFDVGVGGNLMYSFTDGGVWASVRDVILAIAALVLGYVCTVFMGKIDKKAAEN